MDPHARGEQHRRIRARLHRPSRVRTATFFGASAFTPPRAVAPLDEPRPNAGSDDPLDGSDPELVAAVLAGERDRFGALVARHGPALTAWLGRKVRDREEAREVFQETWVRAFEGLAELRDGLRLRAWLISIAHNVLRQRMRRPAEAPLAVEVEEDRGGAVVGAAIERDEFAARARTALGRLSARQREIFRLRVEQELSHAEIGALLAISEENSRAHFHLAIRALRIELGEDDA
jgi:RNA polymerase sigma-70 factor (ECF subfamily)